MASNRSKSKVLQNAKKAFNYSAAPVIADRTPYITGTAQSMVAVAKDLRDWTIRNNPFRAVNGNKDPLIRQIAAASSRAIKAAKLDLKSGDLTFSRLNKQVRDFVGYDEFEDFDFGADIDFGTDYGADFDFDSNSSENIQTNAILSIGNDITHTQASMTSAMIGAVEHSTERITKTQMVMTDSAVTRLITSNMTISARTSSQLGTISENIEIVNKNLSLLVEQGNSVAQYINQSQRYMESTEQSLNDIKALLQNHYQPKETGSNGSKATDFLDGRFDPKKYLNHIFKNTLFGSMASSIVATTFKTLHLEMPSFVDEMFGDVITEINPLKMAIEKLVPAVGRIGDLDKTFGNMIKTFFARLENGEYGGFLQTLGMEGFGAGYNRRKIYNSGGYNKGTIAWNGRAERALMEVIPGYLSNIEGYLKDIAQNTYKGKDTYSLDQSSIRYYDYEQGVFRSIEEIKKQAQRAITSAAQSQYSKFIEMTEKLVDGSEAVNTEMTSFLNKIHDAEVLDLIHDDRWKTEFEAIVDRHSNGNVSKAAKNKAYAELITSRRGAVDNIGAYRREASTRQNSAYYLGSDLNRLNPELIFDSVEKIKQQEYNAMTDEEKRAADAQKIQDERTKSFIQRISDKMNRSDLGRGLKQALSYGGPLNRGIDFVNDQLQSLMIGLVLGGGSRPNSFAVGSHNIPNDQLANIHKGEMIIPKDIADQIRAGNFSDEKVQEWLNITAGSVENSSSVLSSIQSMFVGNSKTKSKTRKAMGAMVEYADDYYKVAIDAEAIKDGDLRGIWVSMLENMANQTAILAHNADRDAGIDDRDGRSELSKRILGEKDKNGLYKGTMFSQYANIGLDFKNAIKHAMYGEEYVTSEGVKVAKSDDTVLSTLSKGMKKAGDTALSYIFGEDYKDTKQFKAVSKGYNEFKAGVTGKASDGVQLTPDEEKAVEEALQQTADKGLELNKKLIGHVKGGLLGAITVGGIGLMGGGGVVPMLLGAGGPIGGAIIGAGLSILTRNESFMDKMFGEMKDGERVGGIISKEMQERWKDLGSKLLGPAVLGAAGSFIFPKLTRGILGPVGSFMLGTGPIAGAALGIGASLIMKSQPVQDLLYGEDGKGGNTGLVGSVKNIAKDFWNKNKQHAGAMGLGGIGGALLGLKGATALGLGGFGLVGSIVGMSILGASFGIKATSDKFKDFLFGSRKFKRDKNGNLVPDGRDGDGLIGKISRKFITSVMTPARVFARSISRNFTEWIRYDVAHQLKSAFEPFTLAIKGGVQGIADGMQTVTEKLMDLAKKITNPIKTIVGGLAKFAGKTVMGGLKTGASIAGNVVSAPLKVLGHFGRRFSKKYDPSVAANNKKFRFGYTDASGKKHRGFWNPLQRLADARDAFLDSDGSFFDALVAGGHMLNPFTAYADAKYQYSKDTGYNNAAFLGGFFGAAGQKHRQIKRANRRKDKMEGRIADATAAWAKDDNWNDKVILNRKELNARNKHLRKIMGKDYDKVLDRFGNKSGSLTSEEMIQFMYDPFGKKKSEKANTFLHDIKHIAYEILQFVSGGKPKGAPLSGVVAKIGNALAPKGGSKRKRSRNKGSVDSSMYDFMKQAKSRGFGSISAIANATGIDVNDLKNFLAGNRDAISGKARRSMFKQMGYIDTSTFGGKIKKAFTTQHALAKYITDGQYRKSVNQKLENKSNVFKYALNAGYRKSLHQQYNVTSSKSLLDCVIDAGYFYGIKQDKKVDYRKLSADTGIDPDKLRNLLEGREDDLKDDERTILYDKVGYVGDKFQAGKLIKNMIGTKVKNKVNSIKTTLYNKTQPLRNAAKKVQSGIGVIKGKIAPLQDKGKELFKQASEAAKFKLDNKMTSKQKEFMHKYLTPYEIKIFKQLSISERNNIMRLWATDDGRSAIAALQQHGKELKKKTDANRKKLGRNVAMTDDEKATFEWLKVNAKKSKLEPDVQKTCLKVYRKMTSTERAEIEVYRKNKDVVGAFAYLKDHAGKIKSFAERVKGAAGALKAGATTIAGKAAAGASSIFGALFGTTGGLKSLAGIAIGAGIMFLFNKFPGIMESIKTIIGNIKDWFVETAWPFITDKVIPAAKKIFEGIGTVVEKIFAFIANPEEEGAALSSNWFTGMNKSAEQLKAESETAAKYGLSTTEEMLNYATGDHGLWTSDNGDGGLAEIVGKKAGSKYTAKDGLIAAYVVIGNEYMLYNNPFIAPTVEQLSAFIEDPNILKAVKGFYKEIATQRGIKPKKYDDTSASDRKAALQQAVQYLEGKYGGHRNVQINMNNAAGITMEQAAANAAAEASGSVGSGHFMQTDPRWANARYANAGHGNFSTMGNGGCGPTALANAAMSQGISTNPMAVARLSRNGGYAVGGGTSAGLFTNGARRLGLQSTAIGAGSIKRALSNGNSVVFAGKGNGLYTRAGHIMSARGIDRRGNVIVDDPMRRNSVSVPLSTLGRGMTHAWSIGRGGETYTDNKGNVYEKITSFDQLSDAAKKKDLTNYSDQDLGMLMAKCQNGEADINIAEFYFLTSQRDINRKNGLADMSSMDYHLSLRSDDSMLYNNVLMYNQTNEKWKDKFLVYTNDTSTIGNAGCVITAFGSLLANLTGLNYRPDFMTNAIAGKTRTGNSLITILGNSRSPSISNATPQRFLINGHTHGQATNSAAIYPNWYEPHEGPFMGSMDWSTGMMTYHRNDDELRFLDTISSGPFVIYGGSSYNKDMDKVSTYGTEPGTYASSISGYSYPHPFYRPSDGKMYTNHAYLVVPKTFGGATSVAQQEYYLYDPGSGQFENQGRALSYSALFSPHGGVQSVFGFSGLASSTPFGGVLGKEPAVEDLNWWQSMYNADDLAELYRTSSEHTRKEYQYDNSWTGTDTSTDESSDDSLLTKIMNALSGLGELAMGMLGRIFGGKGDLPSMSDYNNQPVYNNGGSGGSGGSGYVSNDGSVYFKGEKVSDRALTMDLSSYSDYDLHLLQRRIMNGTEDGLTMNDFYYLTDKRNNPHKRVSKSVEAITSSIASLYPNGADVTPYTSLPGWATTLSDHYNYNKLGTISTDPIQSTKFTANDINAIMNAMLRISSDREGGYFGIANFNSAYADSDGYPAFGISGFNGHYGGAQEVLGRMVASGELSEEDRAIALELIDEVGRKYTGNNPFNKNKLDTLIRKYSNVNKYAQDGYAYQLMQNSARHVFSAYDNGTLRSVEEMIMLNQLSPYGPAHIPAILGLPGAGSWAETTAPNNLKTLKFSSDPLTNLAYTMNDYYTRNTSAWTKYSYMKNELKEAYKNLGGTEVLGFGGGIADSFNSGSYDIVDTPVAIGRTPKVEVDPTPVTTRLDVIINYLRQIANTARQNRAETAATNLDIGHGSIVEKRNMSSLGSNNMPATPVYTDIKNSDRMKAIHDRIARSPRPV